MTAHEADMPTPTPPPAAAGNSSGFDTGPVRNPIAQLLKAPWLLVARITDDAQLPALTAHLLFWGLVFHAIYGFAMALFDSAGAAALTAAKAPLIALASAVLCVPSLYVFSCVTGAPMKLTQVCALAAGAVAMTGLLLLGLTPVAWLFSVSTNSLKFVVIGNAVAWGVAMVFVLRFFGLVATVGSQRKIAGFKWWVLVYVLVTLQMATTLRPLLGKPEKGWRDTEKKFFLVHFKESLANTTGKPDPSPARR